MTEGAIVTAEVNREVIEADGEAIVIETPLIGPEGPPGTGAEEVKAELDDEAAARIEGDEDELIAREAHEALTKGVHGIADTSQLVVVSSLAAYQQLAEKGQANGYAPLDSAGKVPVANLPSSIMEYQGVWDAATNTPTLADGSGGKGDVYRVGVAAERNLGSGAISFEVGDYVIYNGSIWEKSDTTDSVPTVFGRKGNVTAQAGDYSLEQIAGLVATLAGKQPVDSDLTAIAALETTEFGRSLLTKATAAAVRTALELGSAATQSSSAFDAAGAAAAAQAASQPLDSDLTAVAALSTTAYGRAFLELADAAAARTALGLGTAATKDAGAAGSAGKVLNADDPTTTDARTPKAHTHPQSDITGLVEALAAKVSSTDARLPLLGSLAEDLSLNKNSTVLQNLTGLGVAVEKNSIYLIEWWLLPEAANNVMDIKLGFAVPAGCTMKWAPLSGASNSNTGWGVCITTAQPAGQMYTEASEPSFGSRASNFGIPLTALVTVAGTAGTVQPKGSQATADEGLLKLLKSSAYRAHKVG